MLCSSFRIAPRNWLRAGFLGARAIAYRAPNRQRGTSSLLWEERAMGIRIKSVSIRKSDLKYPFARIHQQFVMEDGKGWDLVDFRLHHFEAGDRLVFHRASTLS